MDTVFYLSIKSYGTPLLIHLSVSSPLNVLSCAQSARVDALVRTVPGAAAAPTTAHVTPLTAPASVTQVGSAATAPSVSSPHVKKISMNAMYETCDAFGGGGSQPEKGGLFSGWVAICGRWRSLSISRSCSPVSERLSARPTGGLSLWHQHRFSSCALSL